jgi:RNA polymerase sigma-70 factor (ECF subfamily)
MNAQELDRIVARVQNGDREAFAELVFEVRKELRIFLSAHASSIDMVEEVLQSTLVTAYEIIGRYELRGTFLSWLKGIGRNLLLKELHARARYVTAEEDVLERIIVEAAVDSTRADDRELEYVERLRQCLTELPDDARKLVQQRYYHGMHVKDMARLLGKTETSVAVALFRIRETLRAAMLKEVAP